MKRNLSQLTFKNSFFLKRARKIVGRGQKIFSPKSVYNESNETVEDLYNSMIFSDEKYEEIFDAFEHDITAGILTFPSDVTFQVDKRAIDLGKSKVANLRQQIMGAESVVYIYLLYMLDYVLLVNPKLFEGKLSSDPIAGGYRRSRQMRAKKTRKTTLSRKNKRI